MKYIFFVCSVLITLPFAVGAQTTSLPQQLAGRIVLQVERFGEAWYINPQTLRRHYLGRPADAFALMRELGLGVSEVDFASFQTAVPTRLAGRIILRVEAHGEAYYVAPQTRELHYLGRPADAFAVMREQGLGITDSDLARIAEVNETVVVTTPPFTSQAPLGEWHDDRFQEGCEEAASLMAVYWAQGKTLTPELARREIIAMAAYQDERFGEHRDTSAADTLSRIIRGYLEYDNAYLLTDVSVADIIRELAQGNVVVMPADGQALNNPNFTPPGPLHHALLIYGYDETTAEFITNDPGTRNGAGYRYGRDVLFRAIRDYPSGNYEPIIGVEKKVIVVKK